MRLRLETTGEETIDEAAEYAWRWSFMTTSNIVFLFNGVECEVFAGEMTFRPCIDRYNVYVLAHPEQFPR